VAVIGLIVGVLGCCRRRGGARLPVARLVVGCHAQGLKDKKAEALLPNSQEALLALRRRRQSLSRSEPGDPSWIADGLKREAEIAEASLQAGGSSASKSLGGQRPRSLPSCVATWHAWFKSMKSGAFFESVSKEPHLLPAYTEAARLEGMAGPEDDLIKDVARFLKDEVLKVRKHSCSVADLGCGEAALAEEIWALPWPENQRPEVTSVDAAELATGVLVHDIGALPGDWSERFDVVVLCRALWGTDYPKQLQEARRILKPTSGQLLLVEPFRRWWGRDKERPNENGLLSAVQKAGFSLEQELCANTEALPDIINAEGVSQPHRMEGIFQFVVARPEPSSN